MLGSELIFECPLGQVCEGNCHAFAFNLLFLPLGGNFVRLYEEPVLLALFVINKLDDDVEEELVAYLPNGKPCL